jgi:hypothetical protein
MAGQLPPQSGPDIPAIPVRLSHRPVVGRRAVPWVVAHHSDGTPVLGSVDSRRQATCLAGGACQACGQRLESRVVLMVRAQDVVAGYVTEPGLHPECAAYSAAACPMLTGMMARYRSTPRPARQERCGDASCECRAWVMPGDHERRAGQLRERFAAVWIDQAGYRVRAGPPLRLMLRGIRVLKVRPVAPGQPDGWVLLAGLVRRGSEWPPEVIMAAVLDMASQQRHADDCRGELARNRDRGFPGSSSRAAPPTIGAGADNPARCLCRLLGLEPHAG